nr:helix-turn-helix domain-containing protein [Zongyangia hominis]
MSHIQQIMGISKVSACGLVHSEGFPVIRHGRLIRVSKRAFFDWLERPANKSQVEISDF